MFALAKACRQWVRRKFSESRAFRWWTRHVYWWMLGGFVSDTYREPGVDVGKHTYGIRRETFYRPTGGGTVIDETAQTKAPRPAKRRRRLWGKMRKARDHTLFHKGIYSPTMPCFPH